MGDAANNCPSEFRALDLDALQKDSRNAAEVLQEILHRDAATAACCRDARTAGSASQLG